MIYDAYGQEIQPDDPRLRPVVGLGGDRWYHRAELYDLNLRGGERWWGYPTKEGWVWVPGDAPEEDDPVKKKNSTRLNIADINHDTGIVTFNQRSGIVESLDAIDDILKNQE